MQTSQKLKITTPANENQADFGRKDTKINPPTLEFTPGAGFSVSLPGVFSQCLTLWLKKVFFGHFFVDNV